MQYKHVSQFVSLACLYSWITSDIPIGRFAILIHTKCSVVLLWSNISSVLTLRNLLCSNGTLPLILDIEHIPRQSQKRCYKCRPRRIKISFKCISCTLFHAHCSINSYKTRRLLLQYVILGSLLLEFLSDCRLFCQCYTVSRWILFLCVPIILILRQ